jgi:hypothetical protein
MTDYELNSLNKLGQAIEAGKWSNEGLVQLIKLSGGYLNLMTIPAYAKLNNMSYPGVRDYRNIVNLFDVKFVIDNE